MMNSVKVVQLDPGVQLELVETLPGAAPSLDRGNDRDNPVVKLDLPQTSERTLYVYLRPQLPPV